MMAHDNSMMGGAEDTAGDPHDLIHVFIAAERCNSHVPFPCLPFLFAGTDTVNRPWGLPHLLDNRLTGGRGVVSLMSRQPVIHRKIPDAPCLRPS
jgi:hypothetical protein